MNPSKVTVGDVSDDAIALDVSNNILDARNVMMKYNISRVIITDNKILVGMVTEKDIVCFVYSFNSRYKIRSSHRQQSTDYCGR